MPDLLPSGADAPPAISLGQASRLWLKVGLLSFGGAAGQIALMHRFVVDERRWLDERAFLNALNFVTLLPGPEAQQLATYMGWRLHGVRGGLVAGLFFVLPGALVMLALSLFYAAGRGSPLVEGIFLGIKAAVLAIIVEAVQRIARRAMKTRVLVTIAALAFAALLALPVPFPLVVVAAGLFGLAASREHPGWFGFTGDEAPAPPARPAGGAFAAAGAALILWWLPVGAAALALGSGHILVEIGLLFSKLAVVTFGGAYAVLAYLTDVAVQRAWVTPGEMVDGLGLAETTPGPTILVNQFVGFLAAFRAPAPFPPYVAATLGALITVWVTFAPSFLWIFVGGPYLERIVANRRLAGALAAVTAAVVGVIATLAVRFAVSVLFASSGTARLGPVSLPWPDWTSLRWDAALLAALAAVILFRLHWGVVRAVAIGAAAGLALTLAR
ncbi:chromate efflux transporter [Salinarimonas soli]|uniref:Chromate transporter n=1 Tax=Salinarimonas soli TaxID=1638099 RepID=A0A5B2VCM5_9HYPH|nr:chromate transporter [Salinarimonas soli]KAA2236508.1 chromate transporter [Salinarimonas soli]